jgi:hypothetical protein
MKQAASRPNRMRKGWNLYRLQGTLQAKCSYTTQKQQYRELGRILLATSIAERVGTNVIIPTLTT